jgi:hypothetical protein
MLTPLARAPIARSGGRHGDDDNDDDDGRRDHCGFGWSEPVNLGEVINSPADDQAPTFSEDGLSLYFASDRPGGLGGDDIWVAERACRRCPWAPPVNLGSVINGAGTEVGPRLSADGHLLFLTSERPGGQGDNDLYVSRRVDPKDTFGWGPPVSVGSEVNTAAIEGGAEYLSRAKGDVARLFFNQSPVGGTADIYVVPATGDGRASGPAVLVSELSDPVATDQNVRLRADGREVVFFSTRPGGLGGRDLWTSTRRSVLDAWSTPENLGSLINSTVVDQQPSLSRDGQTLLFASTRLGGQGALDIWMSTRTRSRSGDRDDR